MYLYPPVEYPIRPEMVVQRNKSTQETPKNNSTLQVSSVLDYHKSDAEIERLEAQVKELLEEIEEIKKISHRKPVTVVNVEDGNHIKNGIFILIILILLVISCSVVSRVI